MIEFDKAKHAERGRELFNELRAQSGLKLEQIAEEIGLAHGSMRQLSIAYKDRIPTTEQLIRLSGIPKSNSGNSSHKRAFNYVKFLTGNDLTEYEQALELKVSELEAQVKALTKVESTKTEALLSKMAKQIEALEKASKKSQ